MPAAIGFVVPRATTCGKSVKSSQADGRIGSIHPTIRVPRRRSPYPSLTLGRRNAGHGLPTGPMDEIMDPLIGPSSPCIRDTRCRSRELEWLTSHHIVLLGSITPPTFLPGRRPVQTAEQTFLTAGSHTALHISALPSQSRRPQAQRHVLAARHRSRHGVYSQASGSHSQGHFANGPTIICRPLPVGAACRCDQCAVRILAIICVTLDWPLSRVGDRWETAGNDHDWT